MAKGIRGISEQGRSMLQEVRTKPLSTPSPNAKKAAGADSFDELEQLYQNAPIGLAVVDQELRFVRINDLLAEIDGLSPKEHSGFKRKSSVSRSTIPI